MIPTSTHEAIMTKKASVSYKTGNHTCSVSEQGVSVSAVSADKDELVGWAAIAGLAARAAGKAVSIEPLLARLDAWLAANRERYHAGLEKGATAKALAALSKTLGRPVPPELEMWLSWHDGQDKDLVGSLYEAFGLMSAEQIGASWKERHESKEPGWYDGWIPLLDDYQGDLVVLDPSSPGCAVRELWRGARTQPIVALSLAEWLAEFVGDVEAGLYEEDEERGEFMRMG
jgi:cell wall assembly regulator SMI1